MIEGSPFPGMDPYLEMHWRDVHTSLMVYLRDSLQVQLPGDLFARVEESVTVDADDQTRLVAPDVRVVERPFRGHAQPESSGGVLTAVAEPLLVSVSQPSVARHVVVVDASSGQRVVTAIEVLSPTNKIPGEGREAYRRKQGEYLTGGVNLVEVDLVREGRFTLAVPRDRVVRSHQTPYMVCVRRAADPETAEVYRAPLRERLPVVPVPLRLTDADAALDLQALVDQCYERGRYAGTIDYSMDPEPPFGPVDARWVDELLQASGHRPRPQTAEEPANG